VTATENTFTLEFPYRRTVGPVVGAFLTALRDGQIVGVKTTGGKVLVPPLEYDPESGEATTDEFVEVGPAGTVTGFTWVDEPMRQHPLQQPFAWALVQLEGADTSMLHALAAPSKDAVTMGMRVRPRWRGERKGHITDIECFEPEEG
jgi:hypothetical protein